MASGFGIQTGSFVMPVYMSGNPQDTLTVDTLTDNADTTGTTATTDAQTDGTTDAQEKRVTIENITWKSSPAYDGDVEGVYTFTPVLPGLTLGMYIDISMFIRVGEGEWNTVTETSEPVEVIIGIPEELRSEGREYYIIRAHDGGYTLMNDTDDTPETITINTDLFSAYAIAYQQTDTDHAQDGNEKCGLCHICPTFLSICCFIWLAVIAAVCIVVVLIVRRRKKDEDKKQTEEK